MDRRRSQAVEHAEWRVNFVRSLLASHRLLLARGSNWYAKEAGLVNRLAMAKAELREVGQGPLNGGAELRNLPARQSAGV
jgi:hypothetical protein